MATIEASFRPHLPWHIIVPVVVVFAGALWWLEWSPLPEPRLDEIRVSTPPIENAVDVDLAFGDLTPVCCLQCYLDLEVEVELTDADGAPLHLTAAHWCPEDRDICVVVGLADGEPLYRQHLSSPAAEPDEADVGVRIHGAGLHGALLRVRLRDENAARETEVEVELSTHSGESRYSS